MRDCSKMPQKKLDVLSAMHLIAEPWRLTTPTTKKNCFMKRGFLSDHVNSNDDRAVKLSEDEEDGWHSLRTTQHVTVLLRSVESGMSIKCWINI
jgi:hypothetical protein